MTTRIGNYELIRPLGAGGMAQTFVAMRRGPAGFAQKVCLKRILPQYTGDAALVEQFLDEAKLLAHLRHANVVQVYEFGEADGSYFMALELIDGADLETVLRFLQTKQRPLLATIALHVVRETLKALHYAHNARLDGEPLHLVHRDVSPSNIMLSRAGEVKLVDFGIAKSRHRSHQTRAGHTKGKVAYMSPEQVRGEQLDGRSDLFAVGIVLHELLTGVHPFDAETDVKVLGNVLAGQRPSLSALAPMLRPELVRLIDVLLATDPTRRPQTAADALVLVPTLDNEFQTERLLEELVAACLAEKSVPLDAPLLGPSMDGPGQTAALPVASNRTAPTGPKPRPSPMRGFDAAEQSTTEVRNPTVETLGTDALRAIHAERSPWARASVAVMVLVMVLMGAWLALRDRSPRRDAALAQPSAPAPVSPAPSQQAVNNEQVTTPAAAKPVAPTAPIQAEELRGGERAAPDLPERAPVLLHSPSADFAPPSRPTHGHRSEARPRHQHSSHSRGEARAAATPSTVPVVLSAPVAKEPVAPVQTAPAPTSSPKHRTNVQISGDDF